MARNPSVLAACCASALCFVVAGAPAAADEKRPPAGAGSAQPPAAANAPSAAAPPAEAPAADAKPANGGSKTVTGYGYRDPPKGKGRPGGGAHAPRSRPPAVASQALEPESDGGPHTGDRTPPAARRFAANAGPMVMLPGFEMLADGSSRCFLRMSKPAQVEEVKTSATVSYLLRGAHSSLRNNHNALETVHFNTPVTRARIVQTPRGPAFVLDLRAGVAPSYKLTTEKDGVSVLQIDFPKGDYLPAVDARPADQARLDGHK